MEVRVTRPDFRISGGNGGIGAAVVGAIVGNLRYSHGFIECLWDSKTKEQEKLVFKTSMLGNK